MAAAQDVVADLGHKVILERTRPPTIDKLRGLVANQQNGVLHFMGHGGGGNGDSILLFEDETGSPKGITAQDLIRRIEDTSYLITLNPCVTAVPGEKGSIRIPTTNGRKNSWRRANYA